ncbi:MAG: amidohydrolase family protein [Bacteroidales bacterium]
MAIILKNATYIDWETLDFKPTHIIVPEGETQALIFADVSEEFEKNENAQIIDCKGKFVTKSFAVGHHHVYSALSRGMPPPEKQPRNFREILQYIWWKLDKVLDKETIEASALATAIACAKAGATFVIDHHASPGSIDGSLEIIAKAFEKAGINHLLCYEITDRDGLEKAELGLKENERHLQQYQGLVGLHASFTISDDTLKKAAELAVKYNTGVHIHVAEDEYDQQHCVQTYRKRVVERLAASGVLDSSKTILVHALHLDDNERSIINNSKAYVAQNMDSNLNNKVGLFNCKGLDPAKIMLGTDGMHSDMLQSAQSAFFAGQLSDNINFVSAYQRFRNVHRYLKANNFAGDGNNNLVVLDYDSPTPVSKDNFLRHFVFSLRSNHVLHVISNGKLIVKNKVMQTIDETGILEYTQYQARRLWQQLGA